MLRRASPGMPLCTGVVIVVCLAAAASAQAPPPDVTREAAQAAPPGTGMSSLALQSPLLGGIPTGTATDDTLALSLHAAIERGLAHNLGIVLADEGVRSANGSRWFALGGLLPTFSASLAQARNQINLEAYGFPVAPGESPIIGPFNVSDRRISLSQTVFDYSAIASARAGSALLRAAEYSRQDVREQVVTLISTMYLQAVSTAGRIESARSQQRTAEALYTRAVSMKQAGMVAGIEVLRAEVQVQNQRQRVIYFENELAKQKLALARAVGLPLAQSFTLTDAVPYRALEAMPVEEAIRTALASRPDRKASVELVDAAAASRQAAIAASLPSIGVNADYGNIGRSWDTALSTYAVSAHVRIPLFQGGRERGRLLQAAAALAQQRAQLADLDTRIEYEVRSAFLDVTSADERVRVARTASDLAAQQLTQARDRFVAGVASHVEVVQAQEALATASDNLIGALYAHNLAKAALARALGMEEGATERLLGGQS